MECLNRTWLIDTQDEDILDLAKINERKRKSTFPMNLSKKKKPKTEWIAAYNNVTFSDSCACTVMSRTIYSGYRKSIQYELVCNHKPITCWFLLEGDSKLLNIAIMYNDIKLMKDLLHSGTSPNCEDHLGHTPLHYAVAKNYKQMIRLLFIHGANPNIHCIHAVNPLKLALMLKKDDVALLIETCCELREEIKRKKRLYKRLQINQCKRLMYYYKIMIESKTDEDETVIDLSKKFDDKTDVNHNKQEDLMNYYKTVIESKTDEDETAIDLTKKFDDKTDVNHNKQEDLFTNVSSHHYGWE